MEEEEGEEGETVDGSGQAVRAGKYDTRMTQAGAEGGKQEIEE